MKIHKKIPNFREKKGETVINETHHEYSGHSSMKPINKLRRLILHVLIIIQMLDRFAG